MFGIQHYNSFVAAILVFQLIPGAGTISILNATARNGIGAGLGAVLGTLCGDLVYMLAAVAGLAAVMHVHPGLFRAMQWFGSGYLTWMGFQFVRRPTHGVPAWEEPKQSGWRYFRQALAVSLTNPKVMLFFVAFFPLFLTPGASHATLTAMMVHVTLLSLIYQGVLVTIGNAVARRLPPVPFGRGLATRLAGMTLIGLGIKLATGSR